MNTSVAWTPARGWHTVTETERKAMQRHTVAVMTKQTRPYIVEYVTADEQFHRVTLEALDATDAKHLAESLESQTIIHARARRVRSGGSK